DALRFTLLVGSTPGNDMNLSLKKVEANRNFANKIWNASRLILGALENAPKSAEAAPQYTSADAWIWARQKQLRQNVKRLFESHQYGEAGRQIYDFFWSEFADWYLEIAKLQMAEGGDRAFYTADALVSVLDTCLRLLHPFTPFLTEELWGYLKAACQEHGGEIGLPDVAEGNWSAALIVAPWPEPMPDEGWENQAINDFELLQEIVRSIRNVRAEKNVKPGQKIPATFVAGEFAHTLEHEAAALANLTRLDLDQVSIHHELAEKPEDSIVLVVGAVEIYLPLAGMVDLAEERTRLEKELAETESQIARLEKLLNSPFAEKAPANVVQGERERLAGFTETAEKLKTQIQNSN
ncbi:MAG TPA: valine--tRNA ligase, partial [Chloroflexi bacterium]|nr:valine--tRNA ligase [Chloroflexota bacterium]